jgi:outer membrane receptor for ferrienterochelin and colicin
LYLNTLSYETILWEGLDFKGKAYGNLYDFTLNLQYYPPGHVAMTPAGWLTTWAKGVTGDVSMKAGRTGIELQTIYRLGNAHSIIAGVNFGEGRISDIETHGNYIPTAIPNVLIPLSGIQDLPGIFVQNSETRDFKTVFIEDIWDITNRLCITIGAYYDPYSDL